MADKEDELDFSPDSSTLIACCIKEVNFYPVKAGAIKGSKGSGWPSQKPEAVPCMAFVGNTMVSGTFSGAIL